MRNEPLTLLLWPAPGATARVRRPPPNPYPDHLLSQWASYPVTLYLLAVERQCIPHCRRTAITSVMLHFNPMASAGRRAMMSMIWRRRRGKKEEGGHLESKFRSFHMLIQYHLTFELTTAYCLFMVSGREWYPCGGLLSSSPAEKIQCLGNADCDDFGKLSTLYYEQVVSFYL